MLEHKSEKTDRSVKLIRSHRYQNSANIYYLKEEGSEGKKTAKRVSEMTQQVKTLVAKPVKLSVIPGTLQWDEKTDFYRLPCDLHACTVAHRYSPHPHNNINVILKHF